MHFSRGQKIKLPPGIDPHKIEPHSAQRVSGDALCPVCNFPYYSHPYHPEPGYNGFPYLVVSCDGRALKL